MACPSQPPLRCAAAGYVLGAGLGKGFAQSFDDHRQGQRLQLELDAAGAHRGQQPVRIVRQKEKDSVNRRFFQHLQKGVLSGQTQVLSPGDVINFPVGLIGPDE